MKSAGLKIRVREISLCVIAIMALCVSAVSACACGHHQSEAAAEQVSCHPPSHGGPATVSNEQPLGDSFDSSCGCFVNTPIAAITSASENKNSGVHSIDLNSPVSIELLGSVVATSKPRLPFVAAALNYSVHLLFSGLSRAPPRL
jgi:hypothetical protein